MKIKAMQKKKAAIARKKVIIERRKFKKLVQKHHNLAKQLRIQTAHNQTMQAQLDSVLAHVHGQSYSEFTDDFDDY